jgi:hypothetical protein
MEMRSTVEAMHSSAYAVRAQALASMEASYTSEAAFRANALAHASMYGHAFFDIDDILDSESREYAGASMFGNRKATVVEGSDKADDDEVIGAEDDDQVIGAEDDSTQQQQQQEVNQWDPTRPVGTTLSPEERVQAHQSKFAAEFVVELNMTEAHETGLRMGIVLNRDADFQPATVWRIHKVGLVEEWNIKMTRAGHPEMAVHLGDEIVRVNDIQWHANTETFISRIVGQFQSGRSYAEGASDTLRLYVQRPRVWEHNRFQGQREDAHNHDYAAEFVACVSLPDVLDKPMDETMGWQLVRQHGEHGLEDWMPVIIKTVDRLGPVELWNKEHPDKLILEGDELMQLDNVRFHHNSTIFMKTLQKHYRSATGVGGTNRSALVYIRRPRANQEEFDAMHPVKDVVHWLRPKHSVEVTFPQAGIPNMGWQLLSAKDTDSASGAPLIKKIRPGGLVDAINAEKPESIAAGDLITEIDGLGWEMYEKSSDFYAAVEQVLKDYARKGPESGPVNLVLERPKKLVRHVRANMERGVHIDAKMLRHMRELRTTSTTELPPMFGSDPNDQTKPTADDSASKNDKDDEVIGASEDDDNDVIGASEDGNEESSANAGASDDDSP